MSGHGLTSCFDLTGTNPLLTLGLKGIVTKGNIVTAGGDTADPAFSDLAVLLSFR
jgi:hypothetical protein